MIILNIRIRIAVTKLTNMLNFSIIISTLYMSLYSVAEQDLINLRKLAEQQKYQRSEKIINRILKQTHDVKLAESLSPITENLDEVNKSTHKVGDIIKESISNIDLKSLPNSSKSNNSRRQKLRSLMKSRKSLKYTQD